MGCGKLINPRAIPIAQEKTNAVFKRVFMLLANFEVAFCMQTGYEHTEDLVKAKDELDEYLAGK